MSRSSKNIFFRTGLYNGNRMPYVLDPAHVKIDGRELLDDLNYLGLLSDNITYYSEDGRVENNWGYFIHDYPPVDLAQYATQDIKEIERIQEDFAFLIRSSLSHKKKHEIFTSFFWSTLNLIKPLYNWLNISRRNEMQFDIPLPDNEQLSKIDASINDLWRTGNFGSHPENIQRIHKRYACFVKTLGLKEVSPELLQNISGDTEHSGHSDSESPHLFEDLELAIGKLYEVIINLVLYIQANFEKLLVPTGNEKPYFALLLSFLGRLKELRTYLNTLTKSHLDFYYERVLLQEKSKGISDQAFVLFALKEGMPPVFLKQGTELLAGKDADGNDLVYTTDHDLSVNSVVVSELHTMYVERERFGDTSASVDFVKGIYVNPDPALDAQGVPKESWPLMGCPLINSDFPDSGMREASIGFSIASSELSLGSGQRDISVFLYLDPNNLSEFNAIVNHVKLNEKRTYGNTIFRLFSKAFNLFLTGEKNWIPVSYGFIFNQELCRFEITISLPASAPAIKPYDETVHQAGIATTLPVLRLRLNTHDAPYFAYSLLRAVTVNQIIIQCSVKGVLDLSLFSTEGKLVPGKPFAPLGTSPNPGAYLMVGSAEAFSKKLDSIRIRIDWSNLPAKGFKVQYTGYPDPPDNQSFKIGMGLLQNGNFVPVESKQQLFPLFTNASDDPENQSMLPYTVFSDINLQLMRQTPTWNSAPLPDYAPGVSDGYLRLELTAPPAGFGMNEYANALTNTVIENSKRVNALLPKLIPKIFPQEELLPLPLAPFTPEANSVSLDYTSSIDTNRLPATGQPQFQFFYNNPFGSVSLVTQTQFKELPLVDNYDKQGYLFMGLDNIEAPMPLSIFFRLTSESFYMAEELPVIDWYYLTSSGWNSFSKEQVVSDGTESFSGTGIVNLQIPSDISNDNNVIASGKYWLCASIKKRTQIISPAISISTQALTVTWKDEGNNPSHLDNPLPAGSILSFRHQQPAVQSVFQPLPSTGGVPAEDASDFYIRVSERLYHKQRALLPLDYERIILQQFPDLYMVKCFPNARFDRPGVQPGNVLIIIVSKSDRHSLHELLSPKINLTLCNDVHEYIRNFAPPGILIHVYNPVYEQIKICGTILIRSNYDSGLYLGKLNTALNKFISPWLFDTDSEVRMGEKLSITEILGFISEQPYVDFVTGLSIEVTTNMNGHFTIYDTARQKDADSDFNVVTNDHIIPKYPWSVFVTSSSHRIKLATDRKSEKPEPRGIGNLEIGDDFILIKN